jgi:hypothetical protein
MVPLSGEAQQEASGGFTLRPIEFRAVKVDRDVGLGYVDRKNGELR